MNLLSFELIFVADHNSCLIRTDIHRTIRVTVCPICTYQLRPGTKYKGPFILCTSSNRINAKLCSGLRFHLEYIFEVLSRSMSDVSLDYGCQTVKGSPRAPHFRWFFFFFFFFFALIICASTYHSAIFQLVVQFPNTDLLKGTQRNGQLGVFDVPSLHWHRDVRRRL